MIQQQNNSDYSSEIAKARRSAQYFIDRGSDAQGNTIHSPSAYMDAAIRNVIRRAR